jgi:IMP dehydrogenase
MNPSPVCISETADFRTIRIMIKKYGISSFLVVDASSGESSPRLGGNTKKTIKGILTQRDINNFQFDDEKVSTHMTGIEKLVYYEVNDQFDPLNCDLNSILIQCKSLLISNKIEKIPIITSSKSIVGLVSIKDLKQYEAMTQANKDGSGRLFVGAAVGANKDYIERS